MQRRCRATRGEVLEAPYPQGPYGAASVVALRLRRAEQLSRALLRGGVGRLALRDRLQLLRGAVAERLDELGDLVAFRLRERHEPDQLTNIIRLENRGILLHGDREVLHCSLALSSQHVGMR